MYDVVIVGAGVMGTAVARELSRYQLKIAILEKANDISCGTTKANSGIIHAGYDAPFDSNKGELNVLGNKMYDRIAEELSIPFKRVGSLVLAKNEKEIEILKALKENGEKLNIKGLEIIEGKDIYKLEPNLNKDIIAVLYAPTAGIIEPWEAAIAYAENAIDNGADLRLNFEVKKIDKKDVFKIESTAGEIVEGKIIINCAGVYADDVYRLVEADPEFKITVKKGEYFLLDKEAENTVQKVIFSCPDESGKGVLVAPTVDRNIIIGPDSEKVNCKEDISTSKGRLDYVKSRANELCEKIPYDLNITTFAGLRAEPSNDDFIIEESKVKNFINVAGIKSPGLSAAPAIAVKVVEIVKEISENMVENPNFNPKRRPRIRFQNLSDEEKFQLIKENPLYGRIICRCEMITEGEIVDAINRSAGGRTVNGIKRRVRPGAGRCQGGFCGPRVIEILSRELNVPMESIKQEGVGSYILTGRTKEESNN